MGRAYYYFVASLPPLSFEGKMPVSVEAFLQDCRRLLPEDDSAVMERLLTQEESSLETRNALLRAWVDFSRGLRNELVWWRANLLHKDPSRYLRGERPSEPSLTAQVQQALKLEDLGEAEHFLNRMKWHFLDDLVLGHYFDIEFLFVYGLKLKMLQQYQEYISAEGKKVFQELQTMQLPESCILWAWPKAVAA
ncbi:MAG: DUF2764 family protein [Candidatus Omnitrophica bacterium]|nr:DUF2764 family protein [Candidatus Omnitrophota bacterium]